MSIRWFAQPGRIAIVIGGCARSGTTLLSTLLSSHSRVHLDAIGELDRESRVFRASTNDLGAALSKWMKDHPPAATATHWCEKNPRNIHHVGRILNLFGDAGRFVNVVRDGRDVVTSIHPSDPERYWVTPTRWVTDVAAGRAFEGRPRFLTIRYEDLVLKPEDALRSLCAFVELPFEESLLRYPDSARVRKSGAWVGQSARPLHSESIGRWRDARHRGTALELMRSPKAIELLEFYGYETEGGFGASLSSKSTR